MHRMKQSTDNQLKLKLITDFTPTNLNKENMAVNDSYNSHLLSIRIKRLWNNLIFLSQSHHCHLARELSVMVSPRNTKIWQMGQHTYCISSSTNIPAKFIISWWHMHGDDICTINLSLTLSGLFKQQHSSQHIELMHSQEGWVARKLDSDQLNRHFDPSLHRASNT